MARGPSDTRTKMNLDGIGKDEIGKDEVVKDQLGEVEMARGRNGKGRSGNNSYYTTVMMQDHCGNKILKTCMILPHELLHIWQCIELMPKQLLSLPLKKTPQKHETT